jgi:hypothetical protein
MYCGPFNNKLGKQNLVKYALSKPKLDAIMVLFPL